MLIKNRSQTIDFGHGEFGKHSPETRRDDVCHYSYPESTFPEHRCRTRLFEFGMTNQRIGYGRVSTNDQNPDAQRDALNASSIDRLFIEKFSGMKAHRPALDLLRSSLRAGDTLVITRLDRLGRSTKDLLNIVTELDEAGVSLEVIEQNIDTRSPEGRLFLTMIAAFAEFEHDLMVARTIDGLAAARARGRVGGRKPRMATAQVDQARKLYNAQEMTVSEIAGLFGVSRQTVYRCLERAAPAGAS